MKKALNSEKKKLERENILLINRSDKKKCHEGKKNAPLIKKKKEKITRGKSEQVR